LLEEHKLLCLPIIRRSLTPNDQVQSGKTYNGQGREILRGWGNCFHQEGSLCQRLEIRVVLAPGA
jgi:hypothetical protein